MWQGSVVVWDEVQGRGGTDDTPRESVKHLGELMKKSVGVVGVR